MSKETKVIKSTTKDVKMFYTENDIEKIQLKPNLYIRHYGNVGCNHMSHEIIQNAWDECIDKNSPGTTVQVSFDRKSGRITVKDNGRGIPEKDYPLEIFFTKIQSGSKSTRSQSGSTAGEFGLGATVVTALSTEMEIINHRRDEKTTHTLKFINGVKKVDKVEKNPNGDHGLTVSFIPSEKYLGKGSGIDIDAIYDWMDRISYQLSSENKKIVTKFEVWEGLKAIRKEKIYIKPFSELLSTICEKPVMQQVDLHENGFIEEEMLDGSKVKKNILVEVSFVYDEVNHPDELTRVDSYCNYTNTTDGGVHEVAADEVICRFLQNETRLALSDREKEKIDILWSDVRTDLRMIVNLASNAQVQFIGNAKTQIGNSELIPVIKSLLNHGIKKFFEKHKDLLAQYTKTVKANAKARIELNKIKSVNTKIKTNSFTDHLDENFKPCNNRGKKYKEIYLVEGQKSAMGSVVDARNPDFQAVLGFRGVTANAYKRDLEEIYKNAEWRNYCEKIQFNIKSGDASTVYYNKIIESFDADSDGFGISAGVNAFHAKFAPSIIEAGLLYKVYPPLYLIDDPKHPYARNKEEMIGYYIDTIIERYKVSLDIRKNEKLKKSEFRDLVYDTENYLDELSLIASHYYVNKGLVEVIAYNLLMYAKLKKVESYTSEFVTKALNDQKFITKMMKDIQDIYPEISLFHTNNIHGVIDGKYQAINITPKFLNKVSVFADIYYKYGLYLSYADKFDKEPTHGTIGDFLASATKYTPKIIERYKGLGESNWDVLAQTIMDPSKRILVQLSFSDIERDLKLIELLHGSSMEARRYRKKLMKSYSISRDEIDN